MGILSNNSKIGDKGKDLILQTSGRVYVQVKDRFYPINFRDTENNKNDSNKDNSQSKSNLKGVLIVDDITSYSGEYPGDGTLVIDSKTGLFYKAENNNYTVITSTNTNSFNGTININLKDASQPPIITNSKTLVENLNAEYFSGFPSSEYTKKSNNELITGNWSFKTINAEKIKNSAGTTYIDFARGDISTNTLTTNFLISKNTSVSINKEVDTNAPYLQLSNDNNIDTILGAIAVTETVEENGELVEKTVYKPWINISKLNSYLEGKTYKFDTNGNANIGPIVVNIDGSISIGKYTIDTEGNLDFGNIKLYADGTATIGSGEYQATIDADGKLQIPEKCIIKENI